MGRRSLLHPALFPDADLVSARTPADALLLMPRALGRAHDPARHSVPQLRVSAGFLRPPPVRGRPDRLYSAAIAGSALADSAADRAESILDQILSNRIGSAWWAATPRRCTSGHTVVFASGTPETTRALLRQALDTADAAGTILVMKRPGPIGAEARRMGADVLAGLWNPWKLIEGADHVYAQAGSEPALLADLLGRRDDALRLVRSLLLERTSYVNPFTEEPISCQSFLESLLELRQRSDSHPSITCCVGISFWKRARVSAMVGGRIGPAFRKTTAAALRIAARRGGAIAVWPSRAPAALTEQARAAAIPLLRVEDGFVRSVGLGADFRPPLSLVLDRLGLYYDATGPSDLERLLAETPFPAALLRRAAALRHRMVLDRVTKYNLQQTEHLDLPRTGRIILVPGQVADDRSILLGGAGVMPGLDLLRRVRAQAPDAHIIYKPHPDVEAGHRPGAVPDAAVLRWADRVIRGAAMADLLAQVDEIHTLTSLTGFEALLRGRTVTTYGQPFYAGWGLTTDLNPPPRRTRILALDELVAGTLILYPRYIDPVTLLACGPETVLDRLRDPSLHRDTLLIRARRMQGRLHALLAEHLPLSRAA